MTELNAPGKMLGDVDPRVAANLIATTSDIALVLDRDGVIRDLAFNDELAREGWGSWLGRPWIDTVTPDSRPKVEQLLHEARIEPRPRPRELNHPAPRGPVLPVRYSAVKAGEDGRVIAVGRDLRGLAALQQRLVAAQQSMERDYARLRHTETRYRLLFQIASEAILIVEASSQRVVEANPAASDMLGLTAGKAIGRTLRQIFDAAGAEAVQGLLATVRSVGRAREIQARAADGGREFIVAASLFRQENSAHFLIRLTPVDGAGTGLVVPRGKSRLLKVIENMPDGMVVTGPDHRIVEVNPAFLDMAQLAAEEQARGEPLERWLGRPGIDFHALLSTLRDHGSVRNFGTIVRGEYGSTEDVEVSAVVVANGEQSCAGFMIRAIDRRPAADGRMPLELPRSVEQLTELVGRVSLKDLVRDATDVIERLSIEAALKLTGDNRASAAEMLGLSRQSLYVKLRRYGLGDLDPEAEA